MSGLFRGGDRDHLERELLRRRPEPRPEFVSMLSHRVGDGRRQRRAGFRVALVGVTSAAVLAALSAVGGIGYAANALHSAATAATHLIVPAKPIAPRKPKVTQTSAAAQYDLKKVKVCHNGKTITISQSALAAHLAHGDTRGTCPPFKPPPPPKCRHSPCKRNPHTTG